METIKENEIIRPASAPSNGATVKAQKPRLRLEYLDGLRGLAALYVVFFHVYTEINFRQDGGGLPHWLLRCVGWMAHGHYAVAVFIVLSGYCLMLPVVRTADGKLRGGAWDYLKRRARRILPPYYAALILSLLLIAVVPEMGERHGTNWDWALPAFTPSVLWSHFLLVHNLSPDWFGKINPPMWSVATEWQIYFFFPLLLLPVWRRFGVIAMLVAAFAMGLGLNRLFYPRLEPAAPWYIGLFAMGMAGAVIGFSSQPHLRVWRERIPWGLLSALCVSAFVGAALFRPQWTTHYLGVDIVIGAGTICLILACTRCLTRGTESQHFAVLRLLESRWVVELGTFSYSLYLVHAPLLALLHSFLKMFWLSPAAMFGALLGVGVPLSVGLAYLFHLAFERRFMPGHPRTEAQAAKSAALSPAP